MNRSRAAINILLSALTTMVLLYFLLTSVPRAELRAVFLSYRREMLYLYGALSLLALVLRAYRYRIFFRSLLGHADVPSIRSLIILTGIRNAFVDFLPARLGELSYFVVLQRLGVRLTAAVSTFGLGLVLDIAVLAGICLVLFIYFLFSRWVSNTTAPDVMEAVFGSNSHTELMLLAIVLIVVIGFGTLSVYADRVLTFLSRHFEKYGALSHREQTWLRRFAHRLAESSVRLAKDLEAVRVSGAYPTLVFLTVGLRLIKYGSLYVLLLGVLHGLEIGVGSVHPFIAFVAFLFAETSASLPASGIMGFGTYEAIWTLIFRLSDVQIASQKVLAIGFSIHVITQVFSYTIGILSLLFAASYQRGNQPSTSDSVHNDTTVQGR